MVIIHLDFLRFLLLFMKWPLENDFVFQADLALQLAAAVELYVLVLDDVQSFRLEKLIELVIRSLLPVPGIQLQDVLHTDFLEELLVEVAFDDEAAQLSLL